jgi:hypothetical protein
MANLDLEPGALQKPKKGDAWLDSKKRSAERKAAEKKAMDEVRKLDKVCRVPYCEHMPKKPQLHVMHQEHRGIGGNPAGDRTEIHKMLLGCFIHHREYDHGDLDFVPKTEKGTRGPLDWFRRDKETGEMRHFASERYVGVPETRGA